MVFCLSLEVLAKWGYNEFMKKIAIFALLIVFLIVSFGLRDKNQKIEKTQKILKIGGITLNIDIVNTEAEREKGLSGREGLEENEGMLFVFEKEGYYGFWMKDMKFAIDIVWLDKNKKIVHVEKNVSPETYPKVFNSPIPNLYVLETPVGFLVKNNIQIGDLVAF